MCYVLVFGKSTFPFVFFVFSYEKSSVVDSPAYYLHFEYYFIFFPHKFLINRVSQFLNLFYLVETSTTNQITQYPEKGNEFWITS